MLCNTIPRWPKVSNPQSKHKIFTNQQITINTSILSTIRTLGNKAHPTKTAKRLHNNISKKNVEKSSKSLKNRKITLNGFQKFHKNHYYYQERETSQTMCSPKRDVCTDTDFIRQMLTSASVVI